MATTRKKPAAVWNGPLLFRLVTVPVKAYPARVRGDGEIDLVWLHRDCFERIENRKYCPAHGEVGTGDIVSGYEHRRGKYVVIAPEELDRMRTRREKAIDVQVVIPPNAIDPMFYTDKSYYLLPDGTAATEPYAVFQKALARRQVYGLAQMVLFRRDQVVLIRPVEELLIMTVLSYHGHFRDPAAYQARLHAAKTPARELDLAETLIDSMTAEDFDFSVYRDDYADKLKRLVEARIRGRELKAPPPEEPPATLSFLDALKQSLDHGGTPAEAKPAARSRRARRPG